MQAVPCIAYYSVYFKRKGTFILPNANTTAANTTDFDALNDDAFSEINRPLTERGNSRASLFSRGGSNANL
jgi:hypothetical protein